MLGKPGHILWEARQLRPAAKLKTSSYEAENAAFDRGWKPGDFVDLK